MPVTINTKTHQAIFICLCLLAFTLPTIEVIKNICSLLLVVLFFYQAAKYKVNLRNNLLGNCVLAFMIGSIVASIGSSLHGYETGKINDIIRYGIIGWIVIYTPLTKKQIYLLLASIIVGVLFAIPDAYFNLYTGTEKYFELRSVGHINHSAIYIALILGATISTLLLSKIKKTILALLLPIIFLLIYVLLETNSRATALALGIIIITNSIIFVITNKTAGIITLGVIVVSAIFITIKPPSIINKIVNAPTFFTSKKTTPREKIWNTAIYAWKKEPIFGIGFGNYSSITPELLNSWYPKDNINFSDDTKFLYISHAHNRFINTLTEGGLIGLASLLVLLLGSIVYFWRYRFIAFSNTEGLVFWLIGVNTLAIVIVVGIANTTIHHEHGILTMMLLALSSLGLRQVKNGLQHE
jgi:O-antigen ligase